MARQMEPTTSQLQPPPSALQTLITTHPTSQKENPTPEQQAYLDLALQTSHSLHYQHFWTDLRIHHTSPQTQQPLPRPLISGLPPRRLYIHPDEQIALLQAQKKSGKTGLPDLKPEREWVLPSQLRERWSLRRLGEVFAGVGLVPDGLTGEEVFPQSNGRSSGMGEGGEHESGEGTVNGWRTSMPKRLLLAVLDGDSTVAYYIVHDGVVKPRQN